MKYTKLELVTGLFVLAGVAAVAFLALRIGAGALFGTDTYAVQARFANISGLNAGAQVVISGVTVGRVETIALQEDFSALVTLRVRQDLALPTDSIVSVKTSGLIGDKYLAIAPGADDTTVAPGGLLTDTESTVDLESLISRFAFGGVSSGGSSGSGATGTPAPAPVSDTKQP